MAQITTLSSVGTSAPIMLNPISKSTTVQLTFSSGAAAANVFVQYTLDDGSPPGVVTWAALSSAIIGSSVSDVSGGITYTMLSPIGGLRLSSTGAVTGTITLKALQSITA